MLRRGVLRLAASLGRSPVEALACDHTRCLHQGSVSGSPQYGGYLRTGHAASEADGADENPPPRFLVTGACGQIGTELVPFLRQKVGVDNVIASDVKTTRTMLQEGPFVYCDVTDKDALTRIVLENGVTYVVHLATLLSAVGERTPQLALRINTGGIHNVLDLAATHSLQVYAPSTIAVFGPTSPKTNTPDDTTCVPTTMYGITKVHQELMGNYYRQRFGVDYRSLRYPGIVSAKCLPGGGTTDYAIEIYLDALKHGSYKCFLSEGAKLPMMYMPDCVEATWQIMMAPREKLARSTYNVASMSFSPKEIAQSIKKIIPNFDITYSPDFRDDIAKSWPDSIDDSNARRDWGWQPKYDLSSMSEDMLRQLSERLRRPKPTQQQQQAGGGGSRWQGTSLQEVVLSPGGTNMPRPSPSPAA